jgi:hypothetical protein
MDAEQIAALPEARAYAEWLNAQAAAREAVIEAARELVQLLNAIDSGQITWQTATPHQVDLEQALGFALRKLDALNPPAALEDTQPNASTARVEAYQRGMQEAGKGFAE